MICETFGKKAYETYCKSSKGKSLVSGCDLPTWEELRLEIKAAWMDAAHAVLELKRSL